MNIGFLRGFCQFPPDFLSDRGLVALRNKQCFFYNTNGKKRILSASLAEIWRYKKCLLTLQANNQYGYGRGYHTVLW